MFSWMFDGGFGGDVNSRILLTSGSRTLTVNDVHVFQMQQTYGFICLSSFNFDMWLKEIRSQSQCR